jgi:alpha-beta hydrolase superfamily lysophospholipase
MEHDEDQFEGVGGLRLYYQRWRPHESARAVIVMLHGDFAQSGWYMNLPTHEVPRGYAVYAFDRRGWGRSPGQRGYIHAWSDYLDDLGVFLQVVRVAEPDRPLFLMGHTGSAVIVLEYALQHPDGLKGVFCVSPVLELAVLPAGLWMLAQFLSRLAPRLTLDVKRRADKSWDFISHDPHFNQLTREDPLRNTKITPRWLTEASAAIQRVNAQAAHFPVPLLILVGGADRTAPPQASKGFFQRVESSDKELHEYAGAYTNLLSDSVSEAVLSDIDTWLDRHV